jgi:hypothetical protein
MLGVLHSSAEYNTMLGVLHSSVEYTTTLGVLHSNAEYTTMLNMPRPSSSSGNYNSPNKTVNVDNYGIDSLGESSDDEYIRKRPIPHWARSK